MQRVQLEHIIRAAAGITGASEIVVIGSQAVLGQFPGAPPELLVSMEADVFTFRDPTDADLIEGSIGEGSPFHQTFGYYAHGVAENTAMLPPDWRKRLIRVKNPNTGAGCGLCLEVNDLAVSKLVAGRPKDAEFVANLIRGKLTDTERIQCRFRSLGLSPDRTEAGLSLLRRLS